MNWLDPNQQEQVTYDRLTYIDGLSGILAGPRRVLAVLHDPVQLGLGRRCWYDLAEWLGQRAIECELQGPLYQAWVVQQIADPFRDTIRFSVTYEALALVWLRHVEDVVRYERELLRGWGRPERLTRGRLCTAFEIRSDPDLPHIIEREVFGRIEHEVGALPGDHITQRLPSNPYTQRT